MFSDLPVVVDPTVLEVRTGDGEQDPEEVGVKYHFLRLKTTNLTQDFVPIIYRY